MLHRSESLLTLWQHHSLSILWCNTKTGLSRNNRQCYGKSYRTEPQNISVPEMHKNTVHMFLKRGMIVIQPFRWIGMQNTNLLHAGMLPGFSRAVITVFISHRFDDHSGRLSVRSPCCDNEIRQDIFLFTININFCIKRKRLARTVLIFTERSDQLSRATDRVPGLPANPGYAQ